MTWTQYIFQHLIPTWLFSFKHNFRIWSDLMTSNYENYALLCDDNPEEECREWFWASINEDDTYSKEFLEYLQKLADDVETGKVKTYTLEEMKEQFDDIFGDIEIDLDEKLEED